MQSTTVGQVAMSTFEQSNKEFVFFSPYFSDSLSPVSLSLTPSL